MTLLCLTTCPDNTLALQLAETLVTERLAACVNLIPKVRSVYRWEGAVQFNSEVMLLIKTTDARYPALRARLMELHPYELPELLVVQPDSGLPAYMQWVEDSVKPLD